MIKAIQEYYDEEFAHCYGCGRKNTEGHHLKTYMEDDISISKFTPKDYHIAMEGFVYGGLLASLIDCHGTGSASLFYARENSIAVKNYNAPRFVTGGLTVKFLKPTPLYKELILKGELKEITSKKVITKIEVFVDDIFCVSGEVIAILLPDNFGK